MHRKVTNLGLLISSDQRVLQTLCSFATVRWHQTNPSSFVAILHIWLWLFQNMRHVSANANQRWGILSHFYPSWLNSLTKKIRLWVTVAPQSLQENHLCAHARSLFPLTEQLSDLFIFGVVQGCCELPSDYFRSPRKMMVGGDQSP